MCNIAFFRGGGAYTEVNVMEKSSSERYIQLIQRKLAFSKSNIHLIYIACRGVGIVLVYQLNILRLI